MGVADEDLKRIIQRLIEDVPTARQQAEQQGPDYTAWFMRVEQLVAALGPAGSVFGSQLRRTRDAKTFAPQLLEKSDSMHRRAGQPNLNLPIVNTYVLDATQGLVIGLARAI